MNVKFTENGINIDGEFFSLRDINTKCLTEKVKSNNLTLLAIGWEDSRGFDGVEESIVLPFEKINKIISLISGKQCYFGEIAGKHSEVYGDIDDEDIVVYTEVDKVVEFLEENPTGWEYNHSFLETMSLFNDENGYKKGDECFDEKLDELQNILND
tara:strand:+ start:1060 stop:1527 length:468 start_codon:yes stop_codon:yes gene_type:complete